VRRRQGKAQMAAGSDETKIKETIPPSEVVKPMFDVTWGPMLGILSQVLECADDDRSTAVCLNGFVFAIRLAAHSDMSLARDTFVTSLAKFTYLGSIKEMKRKNVESIRTLLSVAVVDGEYLGESFGPVLQCMSQMAKLRLSASGLESDESFLLTESPRKAPTQTRQELMSPHAKTSVRGELANLAEENNGKAVLEAVQEVLIDKVFSSTVNLSATSLALFVQQLIIVASSEINGSGSTGPAKHTSTMDISGNTCGPSIFSLQRLVEVADFNMDVRPRLVWSQVWGYMADFFVDLARHKNEMVSVFAIDSLKQLSLKFLEKPELSEFNFQSSFLKPFLVVMQQKGSREGMRELVLQCVDIVIRAKAHNLRSGWKIIFSILTISARDKSEKIEYLGLSILQRLLDDHLEAVGCLRYGKEESNDGEKQQTEGRLCNARADDFVHLCKASLSFVQYEAADSLRPFGLTMRAICHIAIYADLIANKRVLPPISGAQVRQTIAYVRVTSPFLKSGYRFQRARLHLRLKSY
jgi:brefeldin A-inhibited guanine nucleotide-exchange protein